MERIMWKQMTKKSELAVEKPRKVYAIMPEPALLPNGDRNHDGAAAIQLLMGH